MPDQKKRLLLPTTMARPGWDLAKSRADVDAVAFPPGVAGAEYHRLLHDTDGIALTSTPLRAADIEAAPRLRAVARIGVGYDAVDVEALTRRGIPLMTCHTDNSPTVSEYAFYMMLHLAKRGAHMDSIPGREAGRGATMPCPPSCSARRCSSSASAASGRASRSAPSPWRWRSRFTTPTCRRRRCAPRTARRCPTWTPRCRAPIS